MALPKQRAQERFSFSDYLTWPEGERWEIIDGEAFAMSPSPSFDHQRISGALHALLFKYFEERPCEVVAAPLDVRFVDEPDQADDAVFNVVQPDLIVVCDKAQIDRRGVLGPPSLVVEILSPASFEYDQTAKKDLYGNYGVPELWIIDPKGFFFVYRLGPQGRYLKPLVFDHTETYDCPAFPDLSLPMERIFRGVSGL